MKKFTAIVIFTAFALTACVTDVASRPQPHFSYKQYPPVALNVASIRIDVVYKPPMQSPHVEHLMPLPLPQAVEDWAHSRFQASGTSGTAIITVTDASMVTQDLPRTKGMKALVTIDQAQRFDAHVAVDVHVEGLTSGETGSGNVILSRSQSIGEDASIGDRDQLWTNLEEAMMTDLDAGAQKMLHARLPFLIK
jgi:hypothetical protein